MNDQYTKRRRIYSGPYSSIYSAKDASNNNVVCLKIVDDDFNMKPHDIRREIKLMRLMKHESIVPLIDTYDAFDDAVIIMPLYTNTLNTLLPRFSQFRVRHDLDNPMNPPVTLKLSNLTDGQVLPFLLKLAGALEYVHSQGIIHRDIKPSNIFFKTYDLSEPILGDFSISYDTKDLNQEEHPSQKYTDVCSGIYKPVELCLGKTDYSYEVDIWSLGITMSYVYSKEFTPILDEGEFNDFHLINNIFNTFGTPYVNSRGNDSDELYWPEMDQDTYHFKKFQFIEQPRKSMSEIFPLCKEDKVLQLLNQMMIYDKVRRITAKGLVTLLAKVTLLEISK